MLLGFKAIHFYVAISSILNIKSFKIINNFSIVEYIDYF
jgi:hypothetical protein